MNHRPCRRIYCHEIKSKVDGYPNTPFFITRDTGAGETLCGLAVVAIKLYSLVDLPVSDRWLLSALASIYKDDPDAVAYRVGSLIIAEIDAEKVCRIATSGRYVQAVRAAITEPGIVLAAGVDNAAEIDEVPVHITL